MACWIIRTDYCYYGTSAITYSGIMQVAQVRNKSQVKRMPGVYSLILSSTWDGIFVPTWTNRNMVYKLPAKYCRQIIPFSTNRRPWHYCSFSSFIRKPTFIYLRTFIFNIVKHIQNYMSFFASKHSSTSMLYITSTSCSLAKHTLYSCNTAKLQIFWAIMCDN